MTDGRKAACDKCGEQAWFWHEFVPGVFTVRVRSDHVCTVGRSDWSPKRPDAVSYMRAADVIEFLASGPSLEIPISADVLREFARREDGL